MDLRNTCCEHVSNSQVVWVIYRHLLGEDKPLHGHTVSPEWSRSRTYFLIHPAKEELRDHNLRLHDQNFKITTTSCEMTEVVLTTRGSLQTEATNRKHSN